MNLSFLKPATRFAARTALQARKHSPDILTGVGVVGFVATTVLVHKSALKADAVIDKAKEDIARVQDVYETHVDDYSKRDYVQDLTIVGTRTFYGLLKVYWPAITVGSLSIAALLGAHGIMKKRNAGLVAAYAAVDKAFKSYRARVVDEFGEDTDKRMRFGTVKEDRISEDEKGKQHVEHVESLDPSGISEYARFFDETNPNWSRDAIFNKNFLIGQQNYANDRLHSRGHIFLNEVYDMLGFPRTPAGAVVGWLDNGTGDGFVDFGMYDQEDLYPGRAEKVRHFVNGFEKSILLDFNVDGMIYELI